MAFYAFLADPLDVNFGVQDMMLSQNDRLLSSCTEIC